MQFFSPMYQWMMSRAKHPRAPYFLCALGFAESSVFPIPPDIILAPMALAKPTHALRYAGLATLSSVLGGLLGYILGMFFFTLIHPYLVHWGYEPMYLSLVEKVGHYGFWVILVAGWGPIPYKIITISAGALGMPFIPFVVASLLSRGARFFLLAALIKRGGERFESLIRRHIESLGWIGLFIIGVISLVMHYA